MIIDGFQFGTDVAQLLGLPKGTRAFTLRCEVDKPVIVECEYYPDNSGVTELRTVFSRYEIMRRDTQQPAEAISFDAWMAERKRRAHDAFMDSHRDLSRMDARLFRCS